VHYKIDFEELIGTNLGLSKDRPAVVRNLIKCIEFLEHNRDYEKE